MNIGWLRKMGYCSAFPTLLIFLLPAYSPHTCFSNCLFSSCLRRNCAGQHQKKHLDETELKKKAKELLINQKIDFADSKSKPEFTAATDTCLPIHNINLWGTTYSTAIDKILFFLTFYSYFLLFSFFLHLFWQMPITSICIDLLKSYRKNILFLSEKFHLLKGMVQQFWWGPDTHLGSTDHKA